MLGSLRFDNLFILIYCLLLILVGVCLLCSRLVAVVLFFCLFWFTCVWCWWGDWCYVQGLMVCCFDWLVVCRITVCFIACCTVVQFWSFAIVLFVLLG